MVGERQVETLKDTGIWERDTGWWERDRKTQVSGKETEKHRDMGETQTGT